MRKNIKIIIASLAVMTTMSSLIGCSGSTSSKSNVATTKEPVKLTLSVHSSWVTKGGQAMVDAANANKDLNVNIELDKIAEGDAGDQVIQTRFAAGENPDILWFYDATWLQKLGGAAKFEDLNGDWTKDYNSSDLATPKYTAEGKLLVAPVGEVTTMSMFYNKKVFKDAGVQVPTNWKEFLDVCSKIKAKNITPVYYSGKDAWTLQIMPLVGSVRDSREKLTEVADALSTNKTKFTDLKLFVDSLAKTKELKDAGYINKTYLSDTYAQAQQALLDGTCAMYAQGSWVVGELTKLSPDKLKDIGSFGIPFDEGQLISISGPYGLFVPSAGKNKEITKKVVNFMSSKKGQQAWFTAQPGIPFVKGVTVNGLAPAQEDISKLIADKKGYASPLDFTKYQKGPFEKYIAEMLVGNQGPTVVSKALDKDFETAAKAKSDPNWK